MTTRAVLLALVVLAGFTVESALGFGATMVTVSLGSMLAPVDSILAAFVPTRIPAPASTSSGRSVTSRSTRTGLPNVRRSRPISSSTIEHSSMMMMAALAAVLSRLRVKLGPVSSSPFMR